MATTSTISLLKKDGTIESAYCHWDGYPSNNGRILLENYNTYEAVEALLFKGNISILGKSPEEIEYYIDRGDSPEKCSNSFYENKDVFYTNRPTEDWNYIFSNGKWYYSYCDKPFYELTQRSIENDK